MDVQRCLLVRILDGADDPRDLPLALLQDITDNFSEERKIGQGGFGVVYKGVLREELFFAVKRIHINENTVDDRLFRREYESLKNISHRNVVRFLGFCSNTHHKTIEDTLSGQTIFANVLERLLCFEYIGNGSLDNHITDELRGLEWETRYEIIIGICKGLRYLHEEKDIIHMDLKPANILLHQDDKYLVPKITDFGLSRTNENSHTVGKVHGTRGYMAPEYRESSKTTPMCDIYCLGLVILELVTGCMEVPNKNNVLRRWRHRWSKPPTQLQYQQVTRCMEIAGLCRAEKPEARPSISKIIRFISESESTSGQQSTYLDDDMLGIDPLKLHYIVQLNKKPSWSVKLTNRTKSCFAFKIEGPSKQYTIWPDQGILPSGCNECLVQITVGPPHHTSNGDILTVWSTKVSESLTVKHITEHTFHKEVDKVDLTVVCDPMESQENIRYREGTNKSAEDVQEKRKTVGSSSGKGKKNLGSIEVAEDISSCSREKCTLQNQQCNLHTLQSFSHHFRASNKYLGDKSRAVDSTRGAMGSLLDKLGKLVTEDYSLDTSVKRDIESFSDDLKIMHQDLTELDNFEGAKIWVDEVRELSYHIEDMVDSFLVRVEPNSNRSGFRELTHEGLKLWENGMMTHRTIADVIKDIKNQVQAGAERKKRYNFGVNNSVANATAKSTIEGLRNLSLSKGIEQLIGIEMPRDEVIKLFDEDGEKNLKIVSIVGLGGLGKTTLAKAVYEKLQKTQYHAKAFVPVGQNPVVNDVLKKLIFVFEIGFETTNLAMWELCLKIQEFLKNKRYFIVIDDIWDSTSWDAINSSFPKNNLGSRVITTTRIEKSVTHDVDIKVYKMKSLSDEDSKLLFLRRALDPKICCLHTPRKKEISIEILKRCGGMPLAINSIASLLAGEPESTWEYVWKSLRAMIEGNDGLKNMMQILDLSYVHLPDDLKTCLLYVCMYPEDREIEKTDLLRLWVAEGFVSRKGQLDAEDVAENNFKALINTSMLEPGRIDYNGDVLSCRVHDIILDLMRSKTTKLNFALVIDGSNYVTEANGQIRRVSVHLRGKEEMRIFETINKESLSCVRSFLFDSTASVPFPFLPHLLDMKYVRVLHLKDWGSGHVDLTCISGMFLLRYLWICFYGNDFKLPNGIEELQQLETIRLYGFGGAKCPSGIVSLPQLAHLTIQLACDYLPDEIGRLKSLRTLKGAVSCSVNIMKGLGELTNLTTLEISVHGFGLWTEEITESMKALHSSISRISSSLRILALSLDHVPSCWSSTPFPVVSRIWKLDLDSSCFQRCPEWIGQLHGLCKFSIKVWKVADVVNIVGGLPFLAYFKLLKDVHFLEDKEESVVIYGNEGAFRSLKHFYFHCPKVSLTFKAGALPKLENLNIWFCHNRYRRFLPAVGIEHLPAATLKLISLSVTTEEEHDKWLSWLSPPNTPRSQEDNFLLKGAPSCGIYQEDLQQHKNNLNKRLTMLSYLLKRAFKEPYPDANIRVDIEEYNYKDDNSVHEEAVKAALTLMGLTGSPQLCQLTSVQLSTLMNILAQQRTSGMAFNAVGEDLDLNEVPPCGPFDLNQALDELDDEECIFSSDGQQ